VPETTYRYARLTAEMDRDRRANGWRWADIAARGGPSVAQLRDLMHGRTGELYASTIPKIARGMGWTEDHVRELIDADPYDVAVEAASRDVAEAFAARFRGQDVSPEEIDAWFASGEVREIVARHGLARPQIRQA
jgi:hypothetical protein